MQKRFANPIITGKTNGFYYNCSISLSAVIPDCLSNTCTTKPHSLAIYYEQDVWKASNSQGLLLTMGSLNYGIHTVIMGKLQE